MKFYVDGAGSSEVSTARICIVYGNFNFKMKTIIEDVPGNIMGLEAEFMAVIRALKMANDGDTIITDSFMVLNAINKRYIRSRVKNMSQYLSLIYKELENKKKINFTWYGRKKNIADRRLSVLKKRAQMKRKINRKVELYKTLKDEKEE